jgi:hypothetical protein
MTTVFTYLLYGQTRNQACVLQRATAIHASLTCGGDGGCLLSWKPLVRRLFSVKARNANRATDCESRVQHSRGERLKALHQLSNGTCLARPVINITRRVLIRRKRRIDFGHCG